MLGRAALNLVFSAIAGLVVGGNLLMSQSSLALSSGAAAPGGSAVLSLSLTSKPQHASRSAFRQRGRTYPAALQWTIGYPAASVSALNVSVGAVLTRSRKSVNCSPATGGYNCIAWGMSSNGIPDGVIATITVTLASTATGSIPLTVSNAMGSTPSGNQIPVTGTVATVFVPGGGPSITGLTCNPMSVASNSASYCTVTLSAAVATSTVIAISSDNPLAIITGGQATVAARASSATFMVVTGLIPSNQTAVITASYSGSSQPATLSLIGTPVVSSLQCAATSLSSGSTTTCTVTLSQSAPANGASISLSSNNSLLTVPASVTIPGATPGNPTTGLSGTFTALAGILTTDQTATVTATYGGASETVTVSLMAPRGISSVQCAPDTVGPNSHTTCTVTASKPAPSGGAAIAITSSNSLLSVPPSITLAANARTGTFNASTLAIPSNQSATITASSNGSSSTATVNLTPVANGLISGNMTTPTGAAQLTVEGSADWVHWGLTTVASIDRKSGVTSQISNYQVIGTGTVSRYSNNSIGYSWTDGTPTVSAVNSTTGVFIVGNGSGFQLTVPADPTLRTLRIYVGAWRAQGKLVAHLSDGSAPDYTDTGMINASDVTTLGVYTLQYSAASSGQTLTVAYTNMAATGNVTLQAASLAVVPIVPDFSISAVPVTSGPASTFAIGVSALGGFTGTVGFAVSGVPAGATAAFAPATVAGNGSTTLAVTSSISTVPGNYPILVTATSGTLSHSVPVVLSVPNLVNVSSLNCPASNLGPNALSSCMVTLSQAAPTGGVTVALSSSSPMLTIPSSVSVPANSVSAIFAASTSSISSDQTATVTAAYNGSSAADAILLMSPVAISSLSCLSASLAPGSKTTCMIALSKPAPAGGATVTLSRSSTQVILPVSATVVATASQASFTATAAGVINSNQTVTLTGSYNGSSATASVAVTRSAVAGSLSGSMATPSGPVQLSLEGQSDWIHWGLNSIAADRKAGVTPQISDYTLVGSHTAAHYSNNSVGYTWTDGAPTVSASNSTTGIYAEGTGDGFQFTVPADTTARALRLYVGAWRSQGKLVAHLSDGSVPDYTDTNLVNTAGVTSLGVYTLVYNAASSGQTLTVTYTQQSATGIATGNATLQAVTLAPASGTGGISPADFLISVTPTTRSVAPGGTTLGYTVTVTPQNNFLGTVSFSASGLPAGANANFTPATVAAGGSTNMVISASAATAGGVYPLTITGTTGALVHTAGTTLSVNAPAITSLQCATSPLAALGSSLCTATISKAAPSGGILLNLTSSTSLLTVPASVTLPSASATATFSVTADSNIPLTQPATVTASYGGSSARATISLSGGSTILSSLQCGSGSLAPNSSGICSVALSNPAPAGGAIIALAATSSRLRVPASVRVPQGQTEAQFSFESGVADQDEAVLLRATAGGRSQTASLGVQAVKPLAVKCDPRYVTAGGNTVCELWLNLGAVPAPLEIALSSNSDALKVPASVETRPGQAKIRFEVTADAAVGQQTAAIEARHGSYTEQAEIAVIAQDGPALTAPESVAAKVQDPVQFAVRATDSQNLPVEVTAAALPAGAQYDAASGLFIWTPSSKDTGAFRVTFQARNAIGKTAERTVALTVGTGAPVVETVDNAAGSAAAAVCSPGSLASIRGRFLFNGAMPLASRSQPVMQFGETKVLINGSAVPLISVSRGRVEFVCPDVAAGTKLSVVVSTDAGDSEAMAVRAEEVAPGVLTVDGTGAGQALAVRSSRLSALPNYRYTGNPTLSGETVTALATGIRCSSDGSDSRLAVWIGDREAAIQSIRPSAYAGVCEIGATVPEGILGDAVALRFEAATSDGRTLSSNTTTIAVGGRQ
jgi:hypothetical protein